MDNELKTSYPVQFWLAVTTHEWEKPTTTWYESVEGQKIVGETAHFYRIQYQDNTPKLVKKTGVRFDNPEAPAAAAPSDDVIDVAQYAGQCAIPPLEASAATLIALAADSLSAPEHTPQPIVPAGGFRPMRVSELGSLEGELFSSPVEKLALERALLQHYERQAVAEVREIIELYPYQRDQPEAPVMVGQWVVAVSKEAGRTMVAGQVEHIDLGLHRVARLNTLDPLELRGYHFLPMLGQEVLAVKLGRLVGGHVVAVNYKTCHVLLCSGYWVSFAEWDLGVRVGYLQGRWFVENENRLQYLPPTSLAAVRRARKARRRARTHYLAGVLAEVPHVNHQRWATAEVLNKAGERITGHATLATLYPWNHNTPRPNTLAAYQEIGDSLKALAQPKWRQLK